MEDSHDAVDERDGLRTPPAQAKAQTESENKTEKEYSSPAHNTE